MRTAPATTTTPRPRRGGARDRLLLPASLIAAALLAGCASLGAGGGGGTDVEPGDGGDTTADPADPAAPVLEVAHGGGFVPVGYDFSSVPQLTVYADGLAVVPGPMIEIFPAPALPNLRAHQLDDADVDELIALAREAGLLAEVSSYGTPPVADAGATTVTLRHDGRTWVHSAEALGFLEAPVEDGGVQPDLAGVTAEEAEARQALWDFVEAAQGLVTAAPEEAYDVEAWAVMGAEVDESTLAPAEDGMERQRLAWPLSTPVPSEMQCVVVDGEEAATLTAALAEANAMTLWESGDALHEAWFRPLLPHEDGCPE